MKVSFHLFWDTGSRERERSCRHFLPPLPRRNLVIRCGTGQKLPSSHGWWWDVRLNDRLPTRRHVQGALGRATEWDPPHPTRQVNKVRISAHDGGDYTRLLEYRVLLWACLVLCQVGCVWLARAYETQGDSHACHAPDESPFHGVHEGQLPWYPDLGIQNSWYVCARSWRSPGSWGRWRRWVGLWDEEKDL